MSEEFPIELQIGAGLRKFFYSQLFVTPRYPTQSFASQTIIVTGSNSGLGLEAARHIYRLKCARLILAVRSVSRGETAKEEIVRSVKNRNDAHAIEVWPVDFASTESVLAFAERVKSELPRVDVLLQSAGVHNNTFELSEGFEQTIQVNVVNTLLLTMSLLPKLRETKAKFPDSSPHVAIVTSEAHRLAKFPEINAPDIYAQLNNGKDYDAQKRYEVSKLLEVLLVRELVSRTNAITPPPVIVDLINPGLCPSNLGGDQSGKPLMARMMRSMMFGLLARTTEVGSRCLVHAASADSSSHGEYMSDGKNQDVESWIYRDVGKRAQKKVFEQTLKVLEARRPGIGKEIGL